MNIDKKIRAGTLGNTLGATSIPAWRESDWLSPDTLHDWIATYTPFQLVDVRDVSEHQQRSLGGKLIPLKDIIKRQGELDPARRIVFYCKSGVRSKAALLAVRSINQDTELYCLEGGVERYLAIYPDETLPVVS
ncbi:putative adenylyltransferase/sulfurtransferase MoeZ [compost metagenome]